MCLKMLALRFPIRVYRCLSVVDSGLVPAEMDEQLLIAPANQLQFAIDAGLERGGRCLID